MSEARCTSTDCYCDYLKPGEHCRRSSDAPVPPPGKCWICGRPVGNAETGGKLTPSGKFECNDAQTGSCPRSETATLSCGHEVRHGRTETICDACEAVVDEAVSASQAKLATTPMQRRPTAKGLAKSDAGFHELAKRFLKRHTTIGVNDLWWFASTVIEEGLLDVPSPEVIHCDTCSDDYCVRPSEPRRERATTQHECATAISQAADAQWNAAIDFCVAIVERDVSNSHVAHHLIEAFRERKVKEGG
jgi:hypothetical protein